MYLMSTIYLSELNNPYVTKIINYYIIYFNLESKIYIA